MRRRANRDVVDPAVEQRARRIRYQNTAREVPQILRWFCVIIVFFDLTAALTGTVFPIEYYLSDVVQIVGMLVMAWLISSRRAPLAATPWLFVLALAISAGALTVQQLVAPEVMTLPIMMIGVIVVGGLAQSWGPFWVAGIPLVIVVGATANHVFPHHGDDWTLAAATGLAAGAAMLVSRRKSSERLAEVEVEMERMAIRDSATGLLNRHGLDQAAATMVALAQRQSSDVFVAFFDISGLKAVNDRYGHSLGDVVIGRVAAALRNVSRDIDAVVRWGGDEFLVIGVGPTPDREDYQARVMAAIDLTGIEHAWRGEVSLGLAAGDPSDLGALIKLADDEMYSVRRSAASAH